jgi:uncharacterized RDD family membrane protein YckC
VDAVLVVANAIIVVNVVSLFVGSRRTPHDRIAGTVVVVSPRSPARKVATPAP